MPDHVLECISVVSGYEDMFTSGQTYPVKKLSPNGKMALVENELGFDVQVVWATSIFGEFELWGKVH